MKSKFEFPCSFARMTASALFALAFLPAKAAAASLIWAGATTGTWDISSANWSGVSGTPWDVTNGPNNNAVFNSASLNATVSGTVFTNGITFSITGRLSSGLVSLSGITSSISVASGQTGTINSAIAGSGTLTKSGYGVAILTPPGYLDNTFSGAVVVNGGTLQLGNSLDNSVPGRGLNFVTSYTINTGGTIVSVGSSPMNAGAIFTLNGGTLKSGPAVGNYQAIGALALNGGTLESSTGYNSGWNGFALNDTVTVRGSATSNITTQGGIDSGVHLAANAASDGTLRTFDVADATGGASTDLLVSAPLLNSSGTGKTTSLIKTGDGTMQLNGANTYSGPTIINNGSIAVVGTLGNTAITVNSPGGLIGHHQNSFNHPITLNGSALSYWNFPHFIFGPLTMNGGSFATGDGLNSGWQFGTLASDVVVGGNSTSYISAGGGHDTGLHLAWNNSGGSAVRTFDVANATGNGNADLIVSAKLINDAGSLMAVGVVKTGAGTMVLSGVNTYSGVTKVIGGTLAVNGSSINDTTPLIISGGKVDLAGAETVDSLFCGAVQKPAGTYSADGINFTGSGTLIVTSGPIPVSVQLDPATVICQKFMGFGAEWDSEAYIESGVTDEDFAVIRKRVEWMRLPTARIMMLGEWCYKGNGQYDWNDPKMNALYRHLDVCQKLGTTVLLTDWGVESWARLPGVTMTDDPKYAEIVSTYMDYLLNVKKYTCIKHFILVNEPNLEVGNWARWKTGVENVSAAFIAKGLQGKVTLMGSDASGNDQWHKDAVDQLQGTLGAYDIHTYASEELVRGGGLFDYHKSNWAYALAGDANASGKPFVISEAGFSIPGGSGSNNPIIGESRYAIAMCDYAVQSANAGSWSVLAWMLDDNSHLGFNWGMWKNRNEGLATRPWFYTWSLLSRCFPAGATVVHANLNSSDVRVLAANWDDNQSAGGRAWTFCIVNRANTPKTVRLNMEGGLLLNLNRYVFSDTSAVVNQDGFPVALNKLNFNLGTGADITCEANSVTILSSIGDGTITAQNIITNGDFSANAALFTNGNGSFGEGGVNPTSAPNWTTTGSGVNGTLTPSADPFAPATNAPSFLFMQSNQTATQPITTVNGTNYLMSFDAAARNGNISGLIAYANNTQPASLVLDGLSPSAFQRYACGFTATQTGSQAIQFSSGGTGDFTTDLTNVSVAATISNQLEIPDSTLFFTETTGTYGYGFALKGDNHAFYRRPGSATYTGDITTDGIAGAFTISANEDEGVNNLTFNGSTIALGLKSLVITSSQVNSDAEAANSKVKLNQVALTTSGNVDMGSGTLEISGSTNLVISGQLRSGVDGNWARFVMGSGTSVNVPGGVNFRANGVMNSNLLFNGGTLTTSSIIGNGNGGSQTVFNGTTIVATASNPDFLDVRANGSTTPHTAAGLIGSGGAIFDTNGFNITIANDLSNVAGQTGSFVKSGIGTLLLGGANTYSGETTVNAGSLAVTGTLGDTTLTVNSPGELIGWGQQSLNHPIMLNGSSLGFWNNHCILGPLTMNGGTLQTTDGINSSWQSVTLAGSVVVGGLSASVILPGGTTVNGIHLADYGSGGTAIRTFNVADATGNGDADLTVSATLINGRGDLAPVGLNKTGTGKMVLSGNNTYTATTNITIGTLAVTGTLGNTVVTVAGQATLGGNGNIGGNVTIAPGARHALAVAPTAGSQLTRAINGTLTLTSGNILDLTAASTPASGVYVLATATVAITGTPTTINYNGINGSVSVDTASTPKRLLLTVGNNAPVASPQSVSTAEDTAKPIILTATDVDGNPLTYTIVTPPAHGSLSGTAPNVTYTPVLNYNGGDSFTFKVNDGIIDSAIATVSITVTAVNDIPVFTSNPIVAAGASEGATYTGQSLAGKATDVDAGDTITYSKISGPAWLAVTPNGIMSGTPAPGTAGLNSFVVRATDNAAASVTATLQITVTVLPLPWLKGDIGTGMLAGSVTYNAGTFTQAGSGTLGTTTDTLNFSYQTLTGDGEIIARISVLQDTGTSSRVGVMIRDTLASNSKQIFMGMSGSNGYRWVRRTTTGGSNVTAASGTGTVPNTWVRLVRSTTTITAYKSTNGTTWTTVGTTTGTTFASNCYIGLAVSSGSNTTLNTSQFTNLSVTP